jgi:hypothetical protein
MKKVLVTITGAVLLAVLLPLALTGANKKADGAPAGKGNFLEVGKTYSFKFQNEVGMYKVLEEPRDGWVRVGVPKRDDVLPSAINLQSVNYIERLPDYWNPNSN